MKKIISLIICLVLIMSAFTATPITVNAAETTVYTSGYYEYTLLADGTAEITEYTGSATTLDIPSELGGHMVTSIGDFAFSEFKKLESIALPKSIKNIGKGAFSYCRSLASVVIPKNVTCIGEYPFRRCVNLSEINVESDNKHYTTVNGVLYNKDVTTLIQYPSGKTDENFIIPDTVTSIWEGCLMECDDIVSVTIPDSVTSIGKNFLNFCKNLVSANIPSKLEAIPSGMLSDCYKLTYINIPASVTAIAKDALKDGYRLEKIDVEAGNKNFVSVDGVLFDKKIKTLITYPAGKKDAEYTVPSTVTTINEYGFENNAKIKKIIIPNNVESIGGDAFSNCENLVSVKLPEGLKTIPGYAFYNCVSLVNVEIPSTLNYINTGAFDYCENLRYVNIPKNVKKIGYHAFNYCENLWHVLYEGKSVAEWNSITIDEGNECLTEATRHYSVTKSQIVYNVIKTPDCINNGKAYCGCYICSDKSEIEFLSTGHKVENEVCTVCHAQIDCQSQHPYEKHTNETWVIYRKNAKSITVTFSSDTRTQNLMDFIYIYDKNNNEIGKYTDSELANKTITVEGDTCKIRLSSDGQYQYYGFRVVNVEVEYEAAKLGDVNGDGEVTIADVTDIQFAISKQLTFNDTQIKAADTDKDGSITVNDVTTLQFYLAKIITEF